MDDAVDKNRRRVLRAGLAAGSLFLPAPYAWVWAQSEGTLKLLRAPKFALVIGNGKYKDVPELRNPANDAKAIGEALRAVGFEVTTKLDAGRGELAAAIEAYTQGLAAKKGVGLFYFAGHGMQLAWRNYLVPVDAVIDKLEDIRAHCVDLSSLIDGINKAANPMNVVILDACRENPFGKDFRVEQKGLSQMDASHSTLLAYATSPGNVASDGAGANGLYTENLLREIAVKEAKIEDVFKRVRLDVRRKTNGAQIPWESTSLEEDFWFQPPAQLKKLSDEEKERLFREELTVWESALGAKQPGPLEDYLRRYPSGKFSELAQLQFERVLAAHGEKKVRVASAQGNPFTKGSTSANTRYKIGDTYTHRILEPISRVEQSMDTQTVVEINDREVVFSSGRVSDLLGNVVRLPPRDGRSFSPVQMFPLEYAVGRRWSTRFITTVQGHGGATELECKVAARERITVPAGTFDAFRLEYEGGFFSRGGWSPGRITQWMAPEQVRLSILREEAWYLKGQMVRGTRSELVSYKQG